MSEGRNPANPPFFLEWVHHLIASDAAMGILQSQLDDAASILPTDGPTTSRTLRLFGGSRKQPLFHETLRTVQ